MSIIDDLVPALAAQAGDSLRSVATYTADGYEFHYRRSDVEAEYSNEDVDSIYEDLLLENLNREYLERLFHAGPLECTVLGFEEAVMLHFTGEIHSGLFVSVDRDRDVEILDIIDTCKDIIDT